MIPQTLDGYIKRNHADDYNWTVMGLLTRRALAAYEIVDGYSHNSGEAVAWAVATAQRGDEVACFTAEGFAVSPRLLAAAVVNRTTQALQDNDRRPTIQGDGIEDANRYLERTLAKAQGILQDKEGL